MGCTALAALAAGVFLAIGSPIPKCAGKPVSVWMDELASGEPKRQNEARQALHHANDRAISWLIGQVETSDSLLRRVISGRNLRVGREGEMRPVMVSGDYRRALAATALGAVGPSAKAALPALARLSTGNSLCVAARAEAARLQIQGDRLSADVQLPRTSAETVSFLKTLSTLSLLGTNITSIQQDYIQSLITGGLNAVFDLGQILCRQKLEPGIAWPLLIPLLREPTFSPLKANALNAAMFHLHSEFTTPAWKAKAKPDSVHCLSDTNRNVRLNAVLVISQSFPADRNLLPASTLRQLAQDPDLATWAAAMLRAQ